MHLLLPPLQLMTTPRKPVSKAPCVRARSLPAVIQAAPLCAAPVQACEPVPGALVGKDGGFTTAGCVCLCTTMGHSCRCKCLLPLAHTAFVSPNIAVFAYEDTVAPIPNITANSTSVFTGQTITVDSLSSICPNSTCSGSAWDVSGGMPAGLALRRATVASPVTLRLSEACASS